MSRCQTANNAKLTVIATVSAIDAQQASIQLTAEQQKSCANCQGKGGCQSLSLYQLFFAQNPLHIANRQYHVGQRLRVIFPDRLISHSVYWLLGLPLLGFISGVLLGYLHHELTAFFSGLFLAVAAYFGGKTHVNRLLQKQLLIQPVHADN